MRCYARLQLFYCTSPGRVLLFAGLEYLLFLAMDLISKAPFLRRHSGSPGFRALCAQRNLQPADIRGMQMYRIWVMA